MYTSVNQEKLEDGTVRDIQTQAVAVGDGKDYEKYDKNPVSYTHLEGETNLIWYPAEVNTSIRPGWFDHPEEDDQVKSLEELIYIYIGAVGGLSLIHI